MDDKKQDSQDSSAKDSNDSKTEKQSPKVPSNNRGRTFGASGVEKRG